MGGGKSILTAGNAPDPGRAVRPWVATLLATPLTHQMADSPFNRLEFTMAFRRTIRSAAGDGIPIEHLGILGIPYEMTGADLMNGNKDLLGLCTDMLR
jgi:hypothetical protein